MAAVIAKGSASIVINPRETEAALVFTPDPGGLGWDADAVIKLIGESRLSPSPSPKTLEPFLQKAAKQKANDPLKLVLFQGTPPEDPAGEEIAWEPLPIPQDIEPLREETLAKAGKPELFRVKTEKIKRESIVKKHNPLPFLPPKEEKVVTWEKKEIREAVEAVSEPREIRYAEKGKKLGTLTPPKPGKPGKTVFNKPIPPAAMGDGTYLLGAGLDREKNEIYARCSGFLRIGDHWADVAPLAKPVWTADRGVDGVTFFFSFEPGDPRFPLPTGAEVLAAAVAKGAAESGMVDPETVDAVIQAAVKTGEAAAAVPLTLTREALARVDIRPDKMEAVLNLRKGAAGGRPLEMKAISQALRDSKVRGFDAEKLKADIKTFMEGPEPELRDYPLVQGKPSTRGADREIRLLVKPLEDTAALLERLKTVPPDKLASGGAVVFPLAEAAGAALVEKGARVAQITGSAGGEPGKDVFGNVLP
ncbi:MAG: FapA family protein, partial [Treponema sp.]|nr:FapA family protein [Treponema sp.]